MNKKFKNNNEDDTSDMQENYLGFFVKSISREMYTVYLDQPFVSPSYYRNIVNMLVDATEDDQVVFFINSPGGQVDGLQTLIEAVRMTPATTIAVLTGEAASAASIFALHCDHVEVLDSCSMLCHQVSYLTAGKSSDVTAHVEHTTKVSQKLIRSTYRFFLENHEIEEILKGFELYLDADQVRDRLAKREVLREKEQHQQQKLQEQANAEPKVSPKPKAARKPKAAPKDNQELKPQEL